MVRELSSMDWMFSWLILTRCVSFHDAAILSNGKRMVNATEDCRIPSSLVPHCPIDGEKMAVHVRCDEYFVEDESWQAASERYCQFLEHARERRTVLLELGVGFNTPSIIRFPFEKMATAWKDTHLVRINQENTQSILDNSRTIAIRKDISEAVCRIYHSLCSERL